MRSRLLPFSLFIITGSLLLAGIAPVTAATSATISHAYKAATSLQAGSLVSLDNTRQGFIQLADITNVQRLIGVTVADHDSLLAIDQGQNMVQVVTRGSTTALVSTLTGDIRPHDKLTVSPFSGVAMKAITGYTAIGTAETAFSANSPGATTKVITDKQGHQQEIAVGYIRLALGIGTTQSGGQALSGFQRLGKSLTGRTLPTYRIIVSLVIAIITLAILLTLLYASLFGSIISIGRNPMARRAVLGSLVSVLSMAGLTVLLAAGLIVFLLR
jgi:hypothetical protein